MMATMQPLPDPRSGRPRALSLDAGGVLLLPDPERIRTVLRPIIDGTAPRTASGLVAGPSTSRLLADRRLMATHYAAMLAFDRPAPSTVLRTARYRAAYARALGLHGPLLATVTTLLAELFGEPGLWSAPAPGARAVVRRLARLGVPLVVVSNTDHGEAAVLLGRAGIVPRSRWVTEARERKGRPAGVGGEGSTPGPGSALWPPVIDSARVGVAKPDPAVFRLALDHLGLPASAVVHVGDSVAADVRGATAAGLTGLHLDPLDRCPERSHPHLAALAEVLDLFEPAAAEGPEPVSLEGGSTPPPRGS